MTGATLESERERRWAIHCQRMADTTRALADWCEDPEMMRSYLDLAAKWLRLAAEGPPSRERRR